MSFWKEFSDLFSHESKKYKTLFLPQYRVDVDNDVEPIKVGSAYCRLWLVEMRLAKDVDWFTKRYPVVHVATRFEYGNQSVTIPYLAGPGYFKELTKKNLDRVIQCSYALTPLFPFNGGTVELQAGLFSMIDDKPIEKFITTLGRFSQLLPVPELSKVINLAGPIYSGVEDLLDIGDRRLELGYQQTFTAAGGGGSNTLCSGYFAAVLVEDEKLDNEALCVVNDSLRIGAPGSAKEFMKDGHQALEGYSYMLFRLEARKDQDWESLTDIKALVNQAQDAIFHRKYDVVKDILLPSIKSTVYRSGDIANGDRGPMVMKIEDDLRKLGLQAVKGEVSKRSLYSIMQQSLPEVDAVKKAELEELEHLFVK